MDLFLAVPWWFKNLPKNTQQSCFSKKIKLFCKSILNCRDMGCSTTYTLNTFNLADSTDISQLNYTSLTNVED